MRHPPQQNGSSFGLNEATLKDGSTTKATHLSFPQPQPAYKLTYVLKGLSFSGIRIFNNLPHSTKILSSDVNKFKYSLNKFLHVGSFYSLGEYFGWKTRNDHNSYK
jgi:hypothetical protein